MQFSTTPAVVALLASMLSLTATAIPAQLDTRQSSGPVVTFSGAGPNPPTYTLTPPFDGTNVTISKSSAFISSCPIALAGKPGHILEPFRMSRCKRASIPRLTALLRTQPIH